MTADYSPAWRSESLNPWGVKPAFVCHAFLPSFCVSSCSKTVLDTNAGESELWDSVSCCNSGSEKTTAALHSVFSTTDLEQGNYQIRQ